MIFLGIGSNLSSNGNKLTTLIHQFIVKKNISFKIFKFFESVAYPNDQIYKHCCWIKHCLNQRFDDKFT